MPRCSPEELMEMSFIVHSDLIDYPNGGLDVLVEVLQNSNALQCLHLSEVNLAHEKLSDALANNRTIKIFYMESDISSEGAKYLANALKYNNTINEIDFHWKNGISIESMKIIADALKVNRGLRHVTLNDNGCVGDKVEGFQSLTDALKDNTSICSLSIDFCHIGNAGAKCLAEAIRVNRTLKRISLKDRSRHIRYEGRAALAWAIVNGSKDLEIEVNRKSIRQYKEYKELAHWMEANRQSHQNEINKKNGEIERKDREIERKDKEINMKNKEIEEKNKEIASLKAGLTGVMQQYPIDLTADDEHKPAAKRPRSDTATKSKLAIMHEQNQKLVQVKQEKTAIEASLQTVTGEKNAMEAELEDAKEDLDIANETVQHQALATDIWQRRFDELAAMVTGRVDAAAIAEIRNRSLADQR